MATAWRSKWLDWQPGDEIISTSPGTELTELTKPNSVSSVSAIPGESHIISASADTLDEWRKEFNHWLRSACVRRPRDFAGLNCLYRSFSEWQTEHSDWAPNLSVFEALLVEQDFLTAEVCGIRLVSGLLLRADALELFTCQHAEQAPKPMPAMPAAGAEVLP